MRRDPLARTFFRSKSAEIAHGAIWPHYQHSPHRAFSNGRHPKMRAARTLYSSRRPTASPPQAVHPPPLPLEQRAGLRPASGQSGFTLHGGGG